MMTIRSMKFNEYYSYIDKKNAYLIKSLIKLIQGVHTYQIIIELLKKKQSLA